MNKVNFIKAFGVSLCLVYLSGCDRAPREINNNVRPPVISNESQRMSVDNNESPTSKELLDYYRNNLKEAKEKWDACKKDLKSVSEEEKPRCVAASNAWHNQPYKASR